MLYLMARGIPAPKIKGTLAKDVKPTPVGPFVPWLVMIVIVMGVVGAGGGFASGGPNPAVIGWSVATIVLLIIGGMCSCIAAAHKETKNLSKLPPVRPTITPTAMRTRAAELEPEPVIVFPWQREAQESPLPVQELARTAVSVMDTKLDKREDERLLRVAAILMANCPSCGAGQAELCTNTKDTYILDRQRAIIVHGARIGNAVKLGFAKITDVVAQFEDHVPADVWEAAL